MIARSECHRNAFRPPSIIVDISTLCPLPAPSVGCPPLPTSASITPLTGLSNIKLFCRLFLISWTSQDDEPYDSLRILFLSFHVFFAHFFDISFEGAVYQRHKHNVHSLFCCEDPMLINFLPLICLVGPVPQHFLIARYQCSLTNSTRYRMDRQKVPSGFLRGRPFAIA